MNQNRETNNPFPEYSSLVKVTKPESSHLSNASQLLLLFFLLIKATFVSLSLCHHS